MSRIAKVSKSLLSSPALHKSAGIARALPTVSDSSSLLGAASTDLKPAGAGLPAASQIDSLHSELLPAAARQALSPEKVGKWKNRVILVAGANGNVGEQLVTRLAKKGVHVALAGRDGGPSMKLSDLKASVEAQGVKSAIFTPDLSDAHEGVKLVKDTLAHFGRLDAVIDLVAIYHHGSFVEHDIAHWSKMIDLNLKGGTALMQEAAKALSHSDMGFYGLASSLAAHAHIGNEIVYCQTKAARRSLTLSFAAEVASGNARLPGKHTPAVTVVSPSLIDSPMAEGRGFDLSRAIGSGDVAEAFMYQMSLRGRTVAPEVILSSRRSPYA